MSKLCTICNKETIRNSGTCKKCYYKEYHLKNYQKKQNFCEICNTDLTGTRKRRCKECKPKSICCDCGRSFSYKVKMKRCTTCYYHWYKISNPENSKRLKDKSNDIFSKRRSKEIRIRRGIAIDSILRGSGPRPEGYLNKKGYRLMIIYEEDGTSRRVYEHVLVMEALLKRRLFPGEIIHHKNGVRDDNRPENLELWNKAQPAGQRIEDRIKYYIDFLHQYGYKVMKKG